MQNMNGGPAGIYGCHGLTSQRWMLMHDGEITNGPLLWRCPRLVPLGQNSGVIAIAIG